MHPHRRTLPGRRQRSFPNFDCRIDIDFTFEGSDRLPRLGIVIRKQPTAMKTMRPGRRPIRRINAL